jgi:alpha-amylase
MRTICLYFQVHQPFRFKRYRFFDIGNNHYYYDDFANESILKKIASKCYLPANQVLLEQIKKYDGKFKVTFSISGVALDQFELYAPEVIASFQELAKTGSVEFLAETNAHSLVALKDREEFARQVQNHSKRIEKYFGQKPKVFRNTELIYSDEMGNMVSEMGFDGMLTEGAKHILGWKSPNYLYYNAIDPKLKVLLKNFKLSDDIAFRFSNKDWDEWPLTAEKYAGWIDAIDPKEEMVNLFMDYETFGEHQWEETGIFDFLNTLPQAIFSETDFTFSTPSEIIKKHQPVAAIHSPHPISWADEERDLTAWLGNQLQEEAFNKLYDISPLVNRCDDPEILKDWEYLQTSDHFYYMCTKFFSDGAVHAYFNPYESPYDAFINYMNVLSDFQLRVRAAADFDESQEIARLKEELEKKDKELDKYQAELKKRKTPAPSKSSSRKKSPGTKQTSSPKSGSEPQRKKSTGSTRKKSSKK